MNKNQFMNELRGRLKRLPSEEIENAVNYYEEYFDDAGAENEGEIIKALGSPASVASKIIGEYALSSAENNDEGNHHVENTKPRKANVLLIVILAIFASPIALPIGLSIIIMVLAIFIVFIAVWFSFAVVAVAGVACVITGFWALTLSFATGLFYLGAGLLMLALGAAVSVLIWKAARIVFRGLQRWLGRLLIRRGSR